MAFSKNSFDIEEEEEEEFQEIPAIDYTNAVE
jgi:hypothetical protein